MEVDDEKRGGETTPKVAEEATGNEDKNLGRAPLGLRFLLGPLLKLFFVLHDRPKLFFGDDVEKSPHLVMLPTAQLRTGDLEIPYIVGTLQLGVSSGLLFVENFLFGLSTGLERLEPERKSHTGNGVVLDAHDGQKEAVNYIP